MVKLMRWHIRDVTAGEGRVPANNVEVDRDCGGSLSSSRGELAECRFGDSVGEEVLLSSNQSIIRDVGTTFPTS